MDGCQDYRKLSYRKGEVKRRSFSSPTTIQH
jgi:hypothetical protein